MRPATFAQLFLLIGVSSSIANAKPSINWHDWQPEAFQEARDQNKLIMVNVGHERCPPVDTWRTIRSPMPA